MLKLIIGVKGTGKTKNLINLVNTAVENSHGDVVCIEKGTKLRYDVKYKARLIDVEEYFVSDAQSLYGFIAGIAASNHDITDMFIDSTLKICAGDFASFEKFVLEMDEISAKLGFTVTMTASMPTEDLTDALKKYI